MEKRMEKLHREVTGTEINNGCFPCTCSSRRKHKSCPIFWESRQVTNPSLWQTIPPGFWEQGKPPGVGVLLFPEPGKAQPSRKTHQVPQGLGSQEMLPFANCNALGSVKFHPHVIPEHIPSPEPGFGSPWACLDQAKRGSGAPGRRRGTKGGIYPSKINSSQ